MTSGLIRCGHCGQANRVPTAAAGTPRCGKCYHPLPWIADADDATFGDVAEGAKIPVLVDLWAPWCGPCRTVSPALEQLARDLAGQVKLVKVNVDTSPRISQRFNAQAIPTLLVLRRGQVIARQTGAAPLAALRTWVDDALASAAGLSRPKKQNDRAERSGQINSARPGADLRRGAAPLCGSRRPPRSTGPRRRRLATAGRRA